jgi:two-component system, sensor histidine kinase and response regulator
MLKVSVADSGIGISSEKKRSLFQKHAQQEVSTARKFGGTGLGLAISRRLVELMGGAIGMDTGQGKS